MQVTVNTSLPITFEKLSNIDDSRFMRVRIWLCHTGKNLNGSIFTKDVLERMAKNSLSNIPILGYIELDEHNKADFQGHEMKLVITEDNMEIVYMGKAIGLIPETNHYFFEKRTGEDGVEYEWLVCDGLLWTKFSEAVKIFKRDTAKGQSIELEPGSIVGTFNKDGTFVFSDAKFEGVCALGAHILPAMAGSVITTFGVSSIKQQLQEMLTELQVLQKGCDSVEDSGPSMPAEVQDVEQAVKFTLTHVQLREEIRVAVSAEMIRNEWGSAHPRYWYLDSDKDNVYAEDVGDNHKLVGFKYSNVNDVISIDFNSKFRVKIAYLPLGEGETFEHNVVSVGYAETLKQNQIDNVTNDLLARLETKHAEFVILQAECEELRAYKTAKIFAERNAEIDGLFGEFSTELSDDEIAQVRATITDQSTEDIRESLFALVGKKKAKFSTVTKKQHLKVSLGGGGENVQVGGKPYGYLIEQIVGKRV